MTTTAKNTLDVINNSKVVGKVSMVLSPVTIDTETSRLSSLAFVRHLLLGCLPNFRLETVTGLCLFEQVKSHWMKRNFLLKCFQNKVLLNIYWIFFFLNQFHLYL